MTENVTDARVRQVVPPWGDMADRLDAFPPHLSISVQCMAVGSADHWIRMGGVPALAALVSVGEFHVGIKTVTKSSLCAYKSQIFTKYRIVSRKVTFSKKFNGC